MILARKFSQAEDNDYERLVAAAGRLRAVLDAFAEGTLPPEYDSDKLGAYAASLVAVQRSDGSFSVSRSPEALDADAATDAHRFVTWVALAFLNRLRNVYPEAALRVPGLDGVIEGTLSSPIAGRLDFPESGPAEPVQQVEAVLVLSAGGIPSWLVSRPGAPPALSSALKQLSVDFRKRLETGDTFLPGGIDYKHLFLQALTALEAPA